MTKYELSLTKNYVPDWTLVDAMRELFQNALDQEITNPSNTMFWSHDEDTEVFKVGNKLSVLEPKTLLLGSSTKADDDSTIGQFGEGYKIATLVLTRLGKKVTFYNYGAREVWSARFSKSRKYGEEILVFEVDKKFPWTSVPDNNLTIVVEGVTDEEYFEIGDANLHMQEGYSHYVTEKGTILLDDDLKGKMFVNGLFICKDDDFHKGYDFKPSAIKLDRDRKLIPNFDLKWRSSDMWGAVEDSEARHDVLQLLKKKAPDVSYLHLASGYSAPTYTAVRAVAYDKFVEEHGYNAVPVSDQEELDAVPTTHKPIMVSESYKKVIKSSPSYEPVPVVQRKSLRERIEEWIDEHRNRLTGTMLEELEQILEEEDTWNE